MTLIDRSMCQRISQECLEEIQKIAKKYGLEAKPKNTTFSSNYIKLQMEIFIPESDEIGGSEADSFKVNATSMGLRPEYLGMSFQAQDKFFKIIGLRTRSWKRPVLCKCEQDGRVYKFSAMSVKMYMNQR